MGIYSTKNALCLGSKGHLFVPIADSLLNQKQNPVIQIIMHKITTIITVITIIVIVIGIGMKIEIMVL